MDCERDCKNYGSDLCDECEHLDVYQKGTKLIRFIYNHYEPWSKKELKEIEEARQEGRLAARLFLQRLQGH